MSFDGPTVTSWASLVDPARAPHAFEPFPAMQTLMLGYTSGTTGRPKGAVHTHAGFTLKVASEVAYSFDVGVGDTFCWITDMGWIMGPLAAFGTHANGATLLLYEGSPDVPDTCRLWDLVQRHRISMLGVSPTLIRALRSTPVEEIAKRDLGSVRVLGSTGEPWDPDSYDWLAADVFGGRVPVINFSGGTEVGGSFLAPYPVEPIPSCSLGGPSLGMDVDVVDDDGKPLRGVIGELVCRQPWPAMTRGVWRDRERYLDSYWSTFPGVWCHGDFALVDESGRWYILGRSDDVMNVAGKRLAPAEVESVLTTHPAVAEAAAVGVPDPKKGETVWAFWVPRAGSTPRACPRLRELVATGVGKPFAPRWCGGSRRCRRHGPPRSCAAPCARPRWAPTRVICRARRTPRPSTPSEKSCTARRRRGGGVTMHWELSEEQELFTTSLREWIAAKFPTDTVRDLAAGASGSFTSALVAEGWWGVGYPEDRGGQGGGALELALASREFGRAAVPNSGWLAAALAAPLLTPEELAAQISGEQRFVPAIRADRAPAWDRLGGTVTGSIPHVLAADEATCSRPRRRRDRIRAGIGV